MFTNCPACSRQFRVRASQLASAEGLVQCGFCGKQFNALERLYDKPIVIEQVPDAVAEQDADREAEFYIPEPDKNLSDENDSDLSEEAALDEFQIELPDSETVSEPEPEPEPEPETEAETETETETETEINDIEESVFTFKPADEPVIAGTKDSSAAESQPAQASQSEAIEYPFPEELLSEETLKPGRLSTTFWSIGVLILLLAGTAQAAWFQRDMLLSHYPELLPYARQLCEQLDCVLIRNRNVSAIKLLNRDVRIHPRYEDALLVNATITNLSRYTQRFPDVLLSLLDSNGEVIAYRQIAATEYLDTSIDLEAGMAADTPIHFVFEVANTSTEAVSFEFDFL